MPYDKLTASRIANQLHIPVKKVFDWLLKNNYIEKKDDGWALTEKGKKSGAEERRNQNGRYQIWPPEILCVKNRAGQKLTANSKLLTSTQIGRRHDISATRMNRILNEIGWIDKSVKGWKITEQGEKAGGFQRHHHQTGVPFVLWPEDILKNDVLIQRIAEDKGEVSKPEPSGKTEASFRERFPATHRTADGHLVRSRAEMLIDNWLYMNEVVHAYERKVPISEDLF